MSSNALGTTASAMSDGENSPRQSLDGYNFFPGPAVVPCSVREQAAGQLADPGGGEVSILEISHRSRQYESIHNRVIDRCRELYALPGDIEVLLLQGGASLQFTMVPQNLIRDGKSADYVETGSWSQRAIAEAAILVCGHRIAGSSADRRFSYIPRDDQLDLDAGAEYLHVTTNNTIYGTQFRSLPNPGDVPIVADISSDIFSAPLSWDHIGMAYGGAQKNAGIAGLTLVFIRKELLERGDGASIPTMLRYSTYARSNSLYNTPPVFAIFVLDLILQWLEGQGGLEVVDGHNRRKAAIIYAALDDMSDFYRGYAEQASRSLMNVTFRIQDESLEARFCSAAEDAGMIGLKGHRSVGGIRASIYNAMPEAGCEALASFMRDFAARNG